MTLPFELGTLPAWVPVWAVPAAILHIALFAALLIPAWVGLARARSGGPLALLLILPVLGLLMLTPIYMNRVLPYAHWSRFWGLLILFPGLNIFFLWIFAFAPWKRRYIPLDQEEYSEPQSGMAPRSATRRDALTGPPAGDGQTMLQGVPAPAPGRFGPRSGDPGTMMAGDQAPPRLRGRSGEPGTMLAGGLDPLPLEDPVPPRGPRTVQPMQPPAYEPPPRDPPAHEPPAYDPPRHEPRYEQPPYEPVREPPRPPAGSPRTLDVAAPRPPMASEPATVRMASGLQHGGRLWRLVGANDVAAAIDFTMDEASLRASESGILVGRSNRAQLVVDHESVSRNHARFIIERGQLCIEDLDSMNGTWVDGQKLDANEPIILQPNGIVEIGKVALRVTGG